MTKIKALMFSLQKFLLLFWVGIACIFLLKHLLLLEQISWKKFNLKNIKQFKVTNDICFKIFKY